jgi:hypothetical protein
VTAEDRQQLLLGGNAVLVQRRKKTVNKDRNYTEK